MSRDIDVDSLKRELKRNAMMALVEREETVDAVPVVRCVECRYYAADKDRPPRGFCMPLHINTVEDWFCADGEKKND